MKVDLNVWKADGEIFSPEIRKGQFRNIGAGRLDRSLSFPIHHHNHPNIRRYVTNEPDETSCVSVTRRIIPRRGKYATADIKVEQNAAAHFGLMVYTR